MRIVCGVITLFLLVSSGCSTANERVEPRNDQQVSAPLFSPSGFLSDYSQLIENTRVRGSYAYVNRDKKLRNYRMVIVEPVELFMVDRPRESMVPQAQLIELASRLERDIKASLKSAYPLVEQAGFGVLRIRAAITDAERERANPIWGGDGIERLSVEIELLDSRSGEQLVAFVDGFERGQTFDSLMSDAACSDSHGCLNAWARMIRRSLDGARGYLPSDREGFIAVQ